MVTVIKPVLPLALVTAVVACSPLKPLAIRSGDVCFRCHRMIVQTRLAAELVDKNHHALTFRTAGCLAKYLVEHPDDAQMVFLSDYTNGKLIRASSAMLVRTTIDENTGERDYVAFRDRGKAIAFARDTKGTVVDWLVVLQQTRAEMKANGS